GAPFFVGMARLLARPSVKGDLMMKTARGNEEVYHASVRCVLGFVFPTLLRILCGVPYRVGPGAHAVATHGPPPCCAGNPRLECTHDQYWWHPSHGSCWV